MDQIELACPYCAGRFQAKASTENRPSSCPHCGRTVTVPAAPRQPLPPALPDTECQIESVAKSAASFDLSKSIKVRVNRRGDPVPLRRLSPDERERYRRRANLAFALVGMAILTLTLFVLLRVRS